LQQDEADLVEATREVQQEEELMKAHYAELQHSNEVRIAEIKDLVGKPVEALFELA
jgi:hypothetical protein